MSGPWCSEWALVRGKVNTLCMIIVLQKLCCLFLFCVKEYTSKNSKCFHEDAFTLEPNAMKKFTFSFPALPGTVGGDIEVGIHIICLTTLMT